MRSVETDIAFAQAILESDKSIERKRAIYQGIVTLLQEKEAYVGEALWVVADLFLDMMGSDYVKEKDFFGMRTYVLSVLQEMGNSLERKKVVK